MVGMAVRGGYMWWAMIRPVFDGDSELWKRRQRQQSTVADVGIFVLAIAFCASGASISWFVLRVLSWLSG